VKKTGKIGAAKGFFWTPRVFGKGFKLHSFYIWGEFSWRTLLQSGAPIF